MYVRGVCRSLMSILLKYRTHTFKPEDLEWNKLGCKPGNKVNDKRKETPEVLQKTWCRTGGQARRRWVLGRPT